MPGAAHKPGWIDAYRLRWKRRRLLFRSLRSRHHLTILSDRTSQISAHSIIAVTTLHNEIVRLPYFLDHYRRLGVDHFLMVDNGSYDGTVEYLREQPDISLWQSLNSYRSARFGLDWMTWLQIRYGHGHWTLMVDADELLIYSDCDSRSLHDLTERLDNLGQSAFGALMIDLYPEGAIGTQSYKPGDDPTKLLCWFDSGPYRSQRQEPLGNLWVQGGARERVFFDRDRVRSPTLNKIPLVRWNRRFAYVNSCHSALPRRLNYDYDGPGGTMPSGVLLHTKFLPDIVARSSLEETRAQHFNQPDQFRAYYERISHSPTLWHPDSVRFSGWDQLQKLGLATPIEW
ncbi:MAG: glycosyltransferase family 2 protein [Pseudomonadota bacterium]